MKLNDIHHVSINVNDIAAAEAFYVDLLGLQKIHRPDLGFPGLWLQVGERQVHLLGIESGKPVREQHFAFHVDAIEPVRTELGVICKCGVCQHDQAALL